MQDISQATNPNTNKTRQKILFSILALALFLGIVYFLYGNKLAQNTDEEVRNSEYNFVFDRNRASTPEYMEQVLRSVDERISNAANEYDKWAETLEKAYILSSSRKKGFGGENETIRESARLFTAVYESTKGNPDPQYQVLKEKAIAGYIYVFTQNGYSTLVIQEMPSDLKNRYFVYFTTEKAQTDTLEARKQEAFKGMIALVDDKTVFPRMKDDKSLNSDAVMIKAMYLDTFGGRMTREQVNDLAVAIRTDMDEYRNGQIHSAGTKSVRLTMAAPFRMAFADYTVKHATENSNDYGELTKVYSTIQNVPGDAYSRTLVLLTIKIYQLGAASRGEYSEEEVAQQVQEMKRLVEESPYQDLVRANLKYNLDSNREWSAIRRDFLALANRSPSLGAFLKEIGVNGL